MPTFLNEKNTTIFNVKQQHGWSQMKHYLTILLFFFIQQSAVYAENDNITFKQLTYNHGKSLQQGRDDSLELLSGLRKLASNNHKESQYMLGVLGLTGLVPFKEFIKNLHQSESNGCAGAAGLIGMLYMEGKFLPKNEQIALGWIRNAAERGDFFSQVFLGGQYWKGSSLIKKDGAMAYSWLYQASLINKPASLPIQASLVSLAQKLLPREVELAIEQANSRLKESGGIKQYFCLHSRPI